MGPAALLAFLATAWHGKSRTGAPGVGGQWAVPPSLSALDLHLLRPGQPVCGVHTGEATERVKGGRDGEQLGRVVARVCSEGLHVQTQGASEQSGMLRFFLLFLSFLGGAAGSPLALLRGYSRLI